MTSLDCIKCRAYGTENVFCQHCKANRTRKAREAERVYNEYLAEKHWKRTSALHLAGGRA
jgi:hypothetical protein